MSTTSSVNSLHKASLVRKNSLKEKVTKKLNKLKEDFKIKQKELLYKSHYSKTLENLLNQISNRFLISSKKFNDLSELYESKKERIYDIP